MTQPCLVTGRGALVEAILKHWTVDTEVKRVASYREADLPAACLVHVSSNGQRSEQRAAQRWCREKGIPFLAVTADADEAVIGPWVLPDQAGCLECLDTRRSAVRPNRRHHEELRSAAERQGQDLARSWSPVACAVVAGAIQSAVGDSGRHGQMDLANKAYVISAHRLTGRVHRFLPDPACPTCSQVPDDAPAFGTLTFKPRLKPDPRRFRAPTRPLRAPEIKERFCDWRMGLIPRLFRVENSPQLAYARAELPNPPAPDYEAAVGRTRSYQESESIAILEALERYAGWRPRGRRTVVRGSHAELRRWAVDPRQLAGHAPEWQQRADFPFRPYSPELELNWVWGYSFRRREPVLIPESLAYYRLPDNEERPNTWLFYEISNGCALGGSLEEAILYGLLEAIERDAFLMAWYTRSPVPELSLDGIADRDALLLVDALEHRGYSVHVFNTTTDFQVPSLWVMVVNRNGGLPASYSAAGAHFDPERALFGALVEAVSVLPGVEESARQSRHRGLELLADSQSVLDMHDHGLLYAQPEALERLSFLFGREQKTPFRQAFPSWYDSPPQPDLTADLLLLVERALQLGCDVWVVDQTPAEVEGLGLHAAKVLVPGTLPMTFGHKYRRTEGVPRLLTVPHQLGYRPRPLLPEELNLLPHPFP